MSQTDLQLILASSSPRRKDLLESVGLEFSVVVGDIDESLKAGELPSAYVSRMAQEKAQSAQNKIAPKEFEYAAILAADTIVCQGDEVFSKPVDYADAMRIWQCLSNAKHQVMTAVCLLSKNRLESRISTTEVEFGLISELQMQQYWDSGEPVDKAGAYAIQGLASAWVQRIHGSYSNVVGLPLYEVNELLTLVELNWL